VPGSQAGLMGKLTNIEPRLSSAPPRLKSPPKVVEQFYSSPDWRILGATVRRTRNRYSLSNARSHHAFSAIFSAEFSNAGFIGLGCSRIATTDTVNPSRFLTTGLPDCFLLRGELPVPALRGCIYRKRSHKGKCSDQNCAHCSAPVGAGTKLLLRTGRF
jgi:hypothetical protein